MDEKRVRSFAIAAVASFRILWFSLMSMVKYKCHLFLSFLVKNSGDYFQLEYWNVACVHVTNV
jgi:hypothetical protein